MKSFLNIRIKLAVLLFYSFEKATFLHTDTSRNYLIDYSLDDAPIVVTREKVQEFKKWLDR